MGLKEELIDFAKENGIDLIGITSPLPFEHYLSELNIRKKYYEERYSYRLKTWEQFATPQKALHNAKSVIVIGFYYYTGSKKIKKGCGKIAQIITYGHLHILRKAFLVRNFLINQGFKAVIGAHRKEAAVRAGLGFIGKNGLVINEKFGSWVAYQSIITDAEMDYDEPYSKNRCGECTMCIRSCPTHALYEPHRVNPQRCVSSLLTRPKIPEEFWGNLGGYILGCDICQEVCPLNKGLLPKQNIESLFSPYLEENPSIDKILALDKKEFKEILEGIAKKFGASSFVELILTNDLLYKIFYFLGKMKLIKSKETIPETFIHASRDLFVYKRNALLALDSSDSLSRELLYNFLSHPNLGKYAKWKLKEVS